MTQRHRIHINLLDLLHSTENRKAPFGLPVFVREEHLSDTVQVKLHAHLRAGITFCYLKAEPRNNEICLVFSPGPASTREVRVGTDFGMLWETAGEQGNVAVWMPCAPKTVVFDATGRFRELQAPTASLSFSEDGCPQLLIRSEYAENACLLLTCVLSRIPLKSLADEVASLAQCERRPLRKSAWFRADRPKYVFNYLINGSIYDPLCHWAIGKRFKCQQCALAWWHYCSLQQHNTGKRLYSVLQDEIAFSVLGDLSDDGEWGHGNWSDDMETHARFHLDGVQLLLNQFKRTGDDVWLSAAEKGVGFITRNLTDRMDDDMVWFEHDTIEHGLPQKFRSTIFGKAAGNTLCLNTHIQALIVLHHLSEVVSDGGRYEDLRQRGLRALRRVLELRPCSFCYRFMVAGVLGSKFDPATQGLFTRARKAACNWLLVPLYPRLRRILPRLFMPNGFLERDLSFSQFSLGYHVITLKDLIMLFQNCPSDWLRPIIERAVGFGRGLCYEKALAEDPLLIEWLDVLLLYSSVLGGDVSKQEMKEVEEKLVRETGGGSLDVGLLRAGLLRPRPRRTASDGKSG